MIIEREEKKERKCARIIIGLMAVVFVLTSASAYIFTAKAANTSVVKADKITMVPGEKYVISKVGKKATYSSKNNKIASVSKKGRITAKRVGKTTVTIKVSSKRYKVTVAVVGLNKSKASMKIGDKMQLKVKNALKSTRWYSTKPNIAKVSGKGLVTAISEGTTVINASTDGKTLKCKVQVSKSEESLSSENGNGSGTLEVHFIDVGQADCIYLKETEENAVKNYMIDCGNGDDKENIINYLKNQGVSSLDGLFLSHWHEDHIGSAPDILTNFEVKKAYIRPNVTNVDSSVYKRTEKELKKIPCEYPKAGEHIELGKIQVSVLGPCSDSIPDRDENKNSMSFILTYGNKKMFFGGDTTQENETEIINSGADLADISVYKVSHHGSTYSTSYAFVRAMTERKNTKDPFYGFISVGKGNCYYHPHQATLERLQQAGATIYRTDQDGTIVLSTDGDSIKVTTENGTSANIPANTVAPSASETEKYIGNKNSKIVHKSSCSSLPAEKNRIYFDSYEEAISQGFSPCRNCLGTEYSADTRYPTVLCKNMYGFLQNAFFMGNNYNSCRQ